MVAAGEVSYNIRFTVVKVFVQQADFVLPILVNLNLLVWKHERSSGVEDFVDVVTRQSVEFSKKFLVNDLKQFFKTAKGSSGTASLQDHLMGEDE